MPNPKRRHSSQRRDKRRSHHALTEVAISTCTNCGSAHKLHTACPSCGFYRGRQVLAVKA